MACPALKTTSQRRKEGKKRGGIQTADLDVAMYEMRSRRTMDAQELAKVRQFASRAIFPLKPGALSGPAAQNLLFMGTRSSAGRNLPAYYLVYFLLVELLNFPNLGRWEKTAWSIPVEFDGTVYLISYRKFGLGVFAVDAAGDEERIEKVVILVKKGIDAAEPYFRWLAEEAVDKSSLNVENNCHWLFSRYRYLYELFGRLTTEAEALQQDLRATAGAEIQKTSSSWNLRHQLSEQASWIDLAATDAFFSWTEHLFVHLSILQGHATTGNQVADVANKKDWPSKFKLTLDLSDPTTKRYYDQLGEVRLQLRNYMAHGAFGKRGEAFKFHSNAGAVPVILNNERAAGRFTIYGAPVIEEGPALAIIEDFIGHLWAGPMAPARSYLQESGLPSILTFASDGTYARAMSSISEMEHLIEGLSRGFDDAANMDF
jgi:hypothetical protein